MGSREGEIFRVVQFSLLKSIVSHCCVVWYKKLIMASQYHCRSGLQYCYGWSHILLWKICPLRCGLSSKFYNHYIMCHFPLFICDRHMRHPTIAFNFIPIWCHDTGCPLLAAEHLLCRVRQSGTLCLMTFMHSRTVSKRGLRTSSY